MASARLFTHGLILAFIAVGLLAHVGRCAGETGPFRLVGVKLVGVTHVSKSELKKALAARLPNPFRFWVPKPVLTEDDLRDDILKIKRIYQAHGYFHVSAHYTLHLLKPIASPPAKRKGAGGALAEEPTHTAKVIFTIEEGPVVRVASVHIRVKDPTGRVGHLTLPERGLLDPGQAFEIEKYRSAKDLLKRTLGNRGYPLAKVTAHALVNIRTNTAAIRFEVDPGPRCRFGELRIQRQGLPVKAAVIRRAVTFTSGTLYDASKVDRSQRNLYNLDIFKAALIRPGEPASGSNAVPMDVVLKSKKRQSVKFGLGYGTEDKLRARAGWIYRNPAGWAGRFSLDAKYSSLYAGMAGKYVQPYFMGPRNALTVAGGIERDHLDSYDNLKTYANTYLTHEFQWHWQTVFGYDLEMNRLENLNVTDPQELARYRRDDNYFISSVSWRLSQSRLDEEINPSAGHVLSLGVVLASEYIGSDVSYVSPQLEMKAYHRAPLRTVIAGRLRMQTIQELGNTDYIPIFKRLFLGGSNTVRGYGYQELGPKDSEGTPLGGLSALNANIELRRKLYGALSGVLFLDAGVVSEKAFDFPLNGLRYGTGVGIRYNTLVGPLRVDLGYKLNPETSSETRWRIHFSIGQAF